MRSAACAFPSAICLTTCGSCGLTAFAAFTAGAAGTVTDSPRRAPRRRCPTLRSCAARPAFEVLTVLTVLAAAAVLVLVIVVFPSIRFGAGVTARPHEYQHTAMPALCQHRSDAPQKKN